MPITASDASGLNPSPVPVRQATSPAVTRAHAVAAARSSVSSTGHAARVASASADAARRQADASLASARTAQAAVARAGAGQAAAAETAAALAAQRTQAAAADAARKASDADVAQKRAALATSLLDDLLASRASSAAPSTRTVQARAVLAAALRENAIVAPPVGTDPLRAAQAATSAKWRDVVAASRAPDRARAQRARSAWLDAVQRQMQTAVLAAWGRGVDRKALVGAQLSQVLGVVGKSSGFDPAAVGRALRPMADSLAAAPLGEIREATSFQGEEASGQRRVLAAKAQVASLATRADTADAAVVASARAVPAPIGGGASPVAAAVSALGVPDAADVARRQASAVHAQLDAAHARLETLQAVFGENGAEDAGAAVGTLQAGYDVDAATTTAAHAKAVDRTLAGEPGASPKRIDAACTAWEDAVDRQTIAVKQRDSVDASAALLDAQRFQAAAASFGAPSDSANGHAAQPRVAATALMSPDRSPFVIVVARRPGRPSSGIALANSQDRARAAQAALDQALSDQAGGTGGGGLAVTQTLRDAGRDERALTAARGAVAEAATRLQAAHGATARAAARLQLGHAQQAATLAQARVDAVDSMRSLRQAQRATLGGAQPRDLDVLTTRVRAAEAKATSLQAAPALSAAQREGLTTRTLPAENQALSGLDRQIRTMRAGGDQGSPALKRLLDRYDVLHDQLALQRARVSLDDAQAAAAAAPLEYAATARAPVGVDLRSPARGAAAEAALTWGIAPGADGRPVLHGLPSNLAPSDVEVRKVDGRWIVRFDESSGADAAAPGSGRFATASAYSGGSSVTDIAIQRGRDYALNPVAARAWEATNTDADVGRSQLVVAQASYEKALARAQRDPQVDAQGRVVPGTAQAASSIDFCADQTAAMKAARADVASTRETLADATSAAMANPLDKRLQSTRRRAQSDADVATAHQAAIGAVLVWQSADFARQLSDADRREGRSPTSPSSQAAESLRRRAVAKVAQWRALQGRVAVDSAQDDVDAAQADVDDWHDMHAYLTDGDQRASSPSMALQSARAELDAARRQWMLAAGAAAGDVKTTTLDTTTGSEEQDDPRLQYRAFMRNPQLMAQPLIDQADARTGGTAQSYAGRDALEAMIAGELGTSVSATRQVADQVVAVGGDDAEVTILPIVYALDADAAHGGGVNQTALFEVQDADDPHAVRYIDATGARYDSLDDYRAHDDLPAVGVKLVMPKDGTLTLGGDGNVELTTADARTETGWQHVERVGHVRTVEGVAAAAATATLLLSGVGAEAAVPLAMEAADLLADVAPAAVESSGLLTGSATSVDTLSTADTAANSADDLAERARHGLSVDPFTDAEARQDVLLSAAALALPGFASTGLRAWRAAETFGREAGALRQATTAFARSGNQVAGVAGGLGMADGGIETARQWKAMTSGERELAIGQFLFNAAVAGGPHAMLRARGATRAAGSPAGSDSPPRTGDDRLPVPASEFADEVPRVVVDAPAKSDGATAAGAGAGGGAGSSNPGAPSPGGADDEPADGSWRIPYSDALQVGQLLRDVLVAGGDLVGMSVVSYPGDSMNPFDGVLGVVREGDPGIDARRSAIAHDNLLDALAANRRLAEATGEHERGIVLVARTRDAARGDIPAEDVLGQPWLRHRRGGDAVTLGGVVLNPRYRGGDGLWVAGARAAGRDEPLVPGGGNDPVLDRLNVPASGFGPAINALRRRPADLDVRSDPHDLGHDPADPPVQALIPVPAGHYAVLATSTDVHGRLIGADGEARTAAQVATLVRRDPAWRGQPVIVVADEAGTGATPFALRLADELDADVYAPDAKVELTRSMAIDNGSSVMTSMKLSHATGSAWQDEPGFRRFRPDRDRTPVWGTPEKGPARPSLVQDSSSPSSAEPWFPIDTSDWLEALRVIGRLLMIDGRVDADVLLVPKVHSGPHRRAPPPPDVRGTPVLRAGTRGADPRRRAVVYPTLAEALAARRRASIDDTELYLVTRHGVGNRDVVLPSQIIAQLDFLTRDPDEPFRGRLTSRASMRPRTLHAAWPEGWTMRDPMLLGTTDKTRLRQLFEEGIRPVTRPVASSSGATAEGVVETVDERLGAAGAERLLGAAISAGGDAVHVAFVANPADAASTTVATLADAFAATTDDRGVLTGTIDIVPRTAAAARRPAAAPRRIARLHASTASPHRALHAGLSMAPDFDGRLELRWPVGARTGHPWDIGTGPTEIRLHRHWRVAGDDLPPPPDAMRLVPQAELIARIASRVPPRHVFTEMPFVGFRIVDGDPPDVPKAIRQHLDAADRTHPDAAPLRANAGGVVALQANADGPDFHVIDKAVLGDLRTYGTLSLPDALDGNRALAERLLADPDMARLMTSDSTRPRFFGLRRLAPVTMVRLSDIGYPTEQALTIQCVWGVQTKPAGADGYLVHDDERGYDLVNESGGLPMGYEPAAVASPDVPREQPTWRLLDTRRPALASYALGCLLAMRGQVDLPVLLVPVIQGPDGSRIGPSVMTDGTRVVPAGDPLADPARRAVVYPTLAEALAARTPPRPFKPGVFKPERTSAGHEIYLIGRDDGGEPGYVSPSRIVAVLRCSTLGHDDPFRGDLRFMDEWRGDALRVAWPEGWPDRDPMILCETDPAQLRPPLSDASAPAFEAAPGGLVQTIDGRLGPVAAERLIGHAITAGARLLDVDYVVRTGPGHVQTFATLAQALAVRQTARNVLTGPIDIVERPPVDAAADTADDAPPPRRIATLFGTPRPLVAELGIAADYEGGHRIFWPAGVSPGQPSQIGFDPTEVVFVRPWLARRAK